jgi:hypothetical protein
MARAACHNGRARFLGWLPTRLNLNVFSPANLVLFAYIMIAGIISLALLIELCFRRGTKGPNRYGPDPLAKAWIATAAFLLVLPMTHYDARGARVIALTILLFSASGAVAQLPPPTIRVNAHTALALMRGYPEVRHSR